MLTRSEFEDLLDRTSLKLNEELASGTAFVKSSDFEQRVREVLEELLVNSSLSVDFHPHPYLFPDIVLGRFGIEVKFTTGDSWRCVANSVFESMRSEDVQQIYILYGKMGGKPEVAWGDYGESVIHVRTSHVPRFEVDMKADRSLFALMGTTYEAFSHLSLEERMAHVRSYARKRLKKGERLWWLEDTEETEHSLPLQARLYMSLSQEDKRRLRAEAAILCPQVVKPSRAKHKYDDATLYLLTYHGVLCPQARDLFSAGSVALRADSTRGGSYILRALLDIEQEMMAAADRLEDALFIEYWGRVVPVPERIDEWLSKADELACTWKPSDFLFKNRASAQADP